MAIAALVLGIVSLCGSPLPILNNATIIAGFIGVVFGIIALFGTRRVMAIAGLALSVAGIAIGLALQAKWGEELDKIGESLTATPTPVAGDTAGQQGESAGQSGLSRLKFGETYQGQRGNITVSAPEAYQPSDTAFVGENSKRTVVVTVTVTNTSQETLTGALWVAKITADGQAGEVVVDTAKGVDPTAVPDILPGKQGTWKVAFGLPTDKPGDLVMSLEWGLSDPVYWEGTG